jgi:hypothetical protein
LEASLQQPAKMQPSWQHQQQQEWEGEGEVTLLLTKLRGACVGVQPFDDNVETGDAKDGTAGVLKEGHSAKVPQESASPAPLPKKDLSNEAKDFLRDKLNAELQQRNKEISDAAWQSLE